MARWRSSGSGSSVRGSWAPASPRSPPRPGSRSCCAAARRHTADAMVAGLEKSLAKQVERGKLEAADRNAVLGRVARRRRSRRARRLRPRDRVDRRGPRRPRSTSSPSSTASARGRDPRHQHVDAARRRDGDGDRPPRQVCGIHFFNPAPMMPLVEVVRAITPATRRSPTRPRSHDVRQEPGRGQGPGRFIVNALLFPYLNNAVRLFDAGVATRDDIDAAMKGGCNFPMGPLGCSTSSASTPASRSSRRCTTSSRTRTTRRRRC